MLMMTTTMLEGNCEQTNEQTKNSTHDWEHDKIHPYDNYVHSPVWRIASHIYHILNLPKYTHSLATFIFHQILLGFWSFIFFLF